MNSDYKSYTNTVLSNIAIASAITAYARIHMIPFKLNNDCYYSDTDSIFLGNELSSKEIGDDLGLMKDELNGGNIEEAYFLGIKQYGYSIVSPQESNNTLINKSVFAGCVASEARETLYL